MLHLRVQLLIGRETDAIARAGGWLLESGDAILETGVLVHILLLWS